MKKYVVLLMVLIGSFAVANAQNQNVNQELANKILSADFMVGDIVFAFNSLNTINIQGNEVDAFLEVKEALKTYTSEIETKQLKIDDSMKMEMKVGIANNLMIFLQRVTLQGANAERYQRFKTTMLEAAKKLQQ